MSSWHLIVTAEAEDDIERLGDSIRDRILTKLKWLRDNFDNVAPIPLGREWRGFLKLRVGDWRVIYEVELLKSEIIIHAIDRRDKIYKRHH